MSVNLSGKTAIVTGGSKGYGYGIAQVLKENGVNVWITSRHEDELKKAADELGVNYKVADVTKPEDWDSLIESVTAKSKTIDILVNNAGGGVVKDHLDNQRDEDIAASVNLNLTGVIYGSKRVVPFMKKQQSGTIITVSSICATEAWPGWSIYSAAKVGLSQFSKCLYLELQDYGVRVTNLIPSWGTTGFMDAIGGAARDAETEAKVTKPREMGDIVLQICELPEHLEISAMTVLPTVQKIMPL